MFIIYNLVYVATLAYGLKNSLLVPIVVGSLPHYYYLNFLLNALRAPENSQGFILSIIKHWLLVDFQYMAINLCDSLQTNKNNSEIIVHQHKGELSTIRVAHKEQGDNVITHVGLNANKGMSALINPIASNMLVEPYKL